MSAPQLLDDDTIDALVRGDDVSPWHGDLAAFATEVRAAGERPPPTPSGGLAVMLAEGTGRVRSGRRRPAQRRRPTLAKVAGVGVVAKLTFGASAAAAGVVGAGATGVLPGSAGDTVRHAIEVVTPLDLAEPGPDGTAEGPAGAPGAGQAPVAPGSAGGDDDRRPDAGADGDRERTDRRDGEDDGDRSGRGTPDDARGTGERDDEGDAARGDDDDGDRDGPDEGDDRDDSHDEDTSWPDRADRPTDGPRTPTTTRSDRDDPDQESDDDEDGRESDDPATAAYERER